MAAVPVPSAGRSGSRSLLMKLLIIFCILTCSHSFHSPRRLHANCGFLRNKRAVDQQAMATTKGHPTPQIKHITIASIVDPSNSPIDNTPLSLTVALTEEDDVHAMLSRMKCFGLKPVGSPTNQTDLVASFAQLEDGQSYDAVRVQSLQYDSFDKTIERLEAYRSNAHNAFAKKANMALIAGLKSKGEEAWLIGENESIRHRAGNTLAGDFDGLVASDHALYVVESKINSETTDVFQLVGYLAAFKTGAVFLQSDHAQRAMDEALAANKPIVGVFATDKDMPGLREAVHGNGLLLLTPNGSGLSLSSVL